MILSKTSKIDGLARENRSLRKSSVEFLFSNVVHKSQMRWRSLSSENIRFLRSSKKQFRSLRRFNSNIDLLDMIVDT